jgi:peptide/nickel transport system substrate-binding protein
VTLIAAIAALLVAGCRAQSNDSKTTSSSASASSGSTSGSAQETQPTPVEPEERTLIYAVPTVPGSLDVKPYEGLATKYVQYALGSALWDYNTDEQSGDACGPLPNYEAVHGQLVDSAEWNEDRTEVRITLKKAQSQYGNELSSEDVKWSLERANSLGLVGFKGVMYNYGGWDESNVIEIVDDKTFILRQATPSALAEVVTSWVAVKILDSKEILSHATADDAWGEKWSANNAANYGPWKVESFDPGKKITLVPNEGWPNERGNVTKLIIQAVPESSTAVSLLRAGDVDIVTGLSFKQYSDLRSESAAGIDVHKCESHFRDILLLQQGQPPFSDVRVRQAVSYAIDRNALIQTVYSGEYDPAQYGVSHVFGLDWTAESSIGYDPEKAKELLKSAGFENGFDLALTYSTSNPGPQADGVAELIQSNLKAVGINVVLDKIGSSGEFSSRYADGNFEAMLYSETPVIYDAESVLATYTSAQYHGPGVNTAQFSSPAWDGMRNDFAGVFDPAERNAKALQMANIAAQEIPAVYLTDNANLFASRNNVTGFANTPDGNLRLWEFSK